MKKKSSALLSVRLYHLTVRFCFSNLCLGKAASDHLLGFLRATAASSLRCGLLGWHVVDDNWDNGSNVVDAVLHLVGIVLHETVVFKNFTGLGGQLVRCLVLSFAQALGLLAGEGGVLFEAAFSVCRLNHGLHRLAVARRRDPAIILTRVLNGDDAAHSSSALLRRNFGKLLRCLLFLQNLLAFSRQFLGGGLHNG